MCSGVNVGVSDQCGDTSLKLFEWREVLGYMCVRVGVWLPICIGAETHEH